MRYREGNNLKSAHDIMASQKGRIPPFCFFLLIYSMISAMLKKKVPKQKTMEGNTSNLNNDCLWVVGLWVVIFLPYFDFSAFFRFS